MGVTGLRKIVISLDGAERSALAHLAEQELRTPRDQARFVLRRELERLGFLSAEYQPATEHDVREPAAEGVRDVM